MKGISNKNYLFFKSIIGSKKSIALAINCRGSTATNCIHFPVCIVIVYHVKISMSTSANNNNNKKKIRIQKPWQNIDLAIATNHFNLLNLEFIGIPWHSLHKPFSEVVEGNGDLHILVLFIAITVAQEHDLVMTSEVTVGDCYGCGAMNCINQPIIAIG